MIKIWNNWNLFFWDLNDGKNLKLLFGVRVLGKLNSFGGGVKIPEKLEIHVFFGVKVQVGPDL